MSRIHNFSAGPAVLPLEVLEKAKQELTDYRGCGMSIMEVSHRGPEYIAVDASARERLMRLLGLGDDHEVMFLQGGASTQFLMVPYNFLSADQTADYINTGTWSSKAIKEAKSFGNVHIAYSSESEQFTRVPKQDEIQWSEAPVYAHFTSNNTIFGTEFASEPASNVPLVCDASSNFLSKPLDVDRYGLIYAGAQKNLGPAGVTVVIAKKDFLAKEKQKGIPTIMKYSTHVGEMFNTPPVFAVYMVDLVLEWIEQKGGLAAMEKINIEKATILYKEIDRDGFYRGTATIDSRSRMNVTFRIANEELEKLFIKESEAAGLSGLKGHRSVGGMRASIYNACPLSSVQALVDFMSEFRRTKG
jgi:phosphoserine aminotransferase